LKIPYRNMVYSVLFFTVLAVALYSFKPITIREISSVEGLVAYAKSFGHIMPLAVFIITVIQAIVPVIPFVILCSADGILFGLTNGILLTWVGTLAGASIMFFAARKMGYAWAAEKHSNKKLKEIDQLQGFRGFWIILALRLLPYFPAPIINISAGVSRINYLWFLLASAVGKLPFIIGYTLLGYTLIHSKNYTLGAALMAALIIIPYLVMRRKRKRMVNSE